MKYVPNIIINHIKEAVDPNSKIEQCWILLGSVSEHGDVIVNDLYAVPNRSVIPEEEFVISRRDVPEALLPKIVGSAHTHLKGHGRGPSFHDCEMALHNSLNVVIYVPTGQATIYNDYGFLETDLFQKEER